jgi:hypothetical protein
MKKYYKEVFMKKNIIFSALAAFVLGGVLGSIIAGNVVVTASPGTNTNTGNPPPTQFNLEGQASKTTTPSTQINR